MEDLKYWVGYSMIPGIGRVKMSLLERHFGNLETAWQASSKELQEAGLDRRALESIHLRRPKISLDDEMEKLQKLRVRVLTWKDPAYPPRLREIYDFPPVLYLRGSLLPEDQWAIAVVGTRKATLYGREATTVIARELAQKGITIVSGLAKGIDTTAHRAALDARGRTIAVFACGLDRVYPAENLSLAREIMEKGAIVSEHPLGTRPEASHFPRRNRIMSGLSLGVLITEAGEISGAHNTVSHAVEQNREVFAVPGNISSPSSRGPHRWIQEGAKLVTSAQDILQELNLNMVMPQMEVKELASTSDIESLLLRCLSAEPLHIDILRRSSGLPISTVSSTLAMLELRGLVRQVGAMNYVLARS